VEYFYNNIIRQHVSVFGSLFNNIKVKHFDENEQLVKELKVPISYTNKDKLIQMYMFRGNDPSNYQDNIQMTMPRFGFEFTDMFYNSDQKLNRLNKFVDYKDNGEMNLYTDNTISDMSNEVIDDYTKNQAYSVYTPVPYKVHVNLYLMTMKETDSLQIVEQILPIFTTHVMQAVKYKIGENINIYFDESINLERVSKEVQFNKDFQALSKTIHTFTFSMDIKFFKQEIQELSNRIIKNIIFRLGIDGSAETVETVEFAAAPLDENIVVNIDRWYDNFYNYMYHDIENLQDSQILEKWY